MDDIKRPVYLTEEDVNFLHGLLETAYRRFEANAKSSESGYGTVTSELKAKKWRDKKDEITDIQSRLSEPFI